MSLADKVEAKGRQRMQEVGTLDLKSGSPEFMATDVGITHPNLSRRESPPSVRDDYIEGIKARRIQWISPAPCESRQTMATLLFKNGAIA
jgi:hypothetical protein